MRRKVALLVLLLVILTPVLVHCVVPAFGKPTWKPKPTRIRAPEKDGWYNTPPGKSMLESPIP